jgi:hypothetical protein
VLRLGESNAASTHTIKIAPAIHVHTAISFTGRTAGCSETYEFRDQKKGFSWLSSSRWTGVYC